LFPQDLKEKQVVNYSYTKKYRNSTVKSWPDHICINKNSETIKVIDCKINNTLSIDSDHLPIILNALFKMSNRHMLAESKIEDKKHLDWLDPLVQQRYSDMVCDAMIELEPTSLINHDYTDADNDKQLALEMTITLNDISHKLNKIKCELSERITVENEIEKAKDMKYYKKRNYWWDEKLAKLHRLKCEAYTMYKSTNFSKQFETKYLEAKVTFRRYSNYTKKYKSNARFRRIAELFKYKLNDFWKQVNIMKKVKRMINIPIDELRKYYYDLFNKHNVDDQKIDDENESKINEILKEHERKRRSGENEILKVDDKLLNKIINELKNGKSVGWTGISNEMLKYAKCEKLLVILAKVFEIILNTGVIPQLFNISILKPLIKDVNKPSNDKNNQRPLSISDVAPSILERIIDYYIKLQHSDHPKQFGFKANSSCLHATFILNELMKICKKRNVNLYIVSIDASKAFDKVVRNVLWLKMIEMNIHTSIVVCLCNYYKNFYIIIKNDMFYSTPFKTLCGVKQGGNASPTLYKLYGETLAWLIDQLNIGVTVGSMKINILMYADDIIIVADNRLDAQKMLDTVTDFGHEFKVKFNPDKTNLMVISSNKIDVDLKLCGSSICRSKEIKYLGNLININGKARSHLNSRIKAAYASMSNLTSTAIINSCMDMFTKIKLFKVYIRPLLLYGMETIQLNGDECNDLKVTEGNMLKKMIGIPNSSKSTELYDLFNITTTQTQLNVSKLKLIKRMQTNSYTNSIIMECIKLKEFGGLIGEAAKILGVEVIKNVNEMNERIEEFLCNVKIRALQIVKTPEIKDLRRILDIENVELVKYILKMKLSTY